MTDLLTELPNIVESKFRFQNQKAMLTYKTHINKIDFEGFINRLKQTKKLYIAHENGLNDPVTPYEHTHVVLDFGEVFQSRNSRIFDFEGIHPHISKITNVNSWRKACQYICKEDKSVILDTGDNFGNSIAEDIWKNKTIQDALTNMTNIKDALATIAVYNQKPLEWGREIQCAIQDEEDMFPWQKSIWTYIHTIPNDRNVYWIADEDGCKGKTQLIKYSAIKEPEKVMWIVPSGTTRDIIHVYMDQINKGWRGDTIMINLSRSATSCSDMAHVYRIIEDIKDGMIFDSKYTGGLLLTPSPHIIVMCNKLPETDRLTSDRWKIGKISPQKELYELPPVTLNRGQPGTSEKGYKF